MMILSILQKENDMKKRLTILFLIFTMAFSFITIARAEDLHDEGTIVTPLDELGSEAEEYGRRLLLFNCWLEVMELNYMPAVGFCDGYETHPVIIYYVPKQTPVSFKMMVTFPDKHKEIFQTDWNVHSPGIHNTCLACTYDFPGKYTQPGIYSLKILVIAKGAGRAIHKSNFLVVDCP